MGNKGDNTEFEDMTTINDDEWGEPVPVTVRRSATISVRFSAEELAAIRKRANAAGMKVTTYIRQAATGGDVSLDREKVARAVATVSADLEMVQRLVQGAA